MKHSLFFLLFLLATTGCASDATILNPGGTGTPINTSITLPGTSWLLTSYADGSGTTVALDSALQGRVSIIFRNDSTVGGSDGCNTYSATYITLNSNIAFENMFGTKLACKIGTALQQALISGSTYSANAKTLQIDSRMGSMNRMWFARN